MVVDFLVESFELSWPGSELRVWIFQLLIFFAALGLSCRLLSAVFCRNHRRLSRPRQIYFDRFPDDFLLRKLTVRHTRFARRNIDYPNPLSSPN